MYPVITVLSESCASVSALGVDVLAEMTLTSETNKNPPLF